MSEGGNRVWMGWIQLTVDEGVQDGHGAVGDTSVRVHLLEDCGWRVSKSSILLRLGWMRWIGVRLRRRSAVDGVPL